MKDEKPYRTNPKVVFWPPQATKSIHMLRPVHIQKETEVQLGILNVGKTQSFWVCSEVVAGKILLQSPSLHPSVLTSTS